MLSFFSTFYQAMAFPMTFPTGCYFSSNQSTPLKENVVTPLEENIGPQCFFGIPASYTCLPSSINYSYSLNDATELQTKTSEVAQRSIPSPVATAPPIELENKKNSKSWHSYYDSKFQATLSKLLSFEPTILCPDDSPEKHLKDYLLQDYLDHNRLFEGPKEKACGALGYMYGEIPSSQKSIKDMIELIGEVLSGNTNQISDDLLSPEEIEAIDQGKLETVMENKGKEAYREASKNHKAISKGIVLTYHALVKHHSGCKQKC